MFAKHNATVQLHFELSVSSLYSVFSEYLRILLTYIWSHASSVAFLFRLLLEEKVARNATDEV